MLLGATDIKKVKEFYKNPRVVLVDLDIALDPQGVVMQATPMAPARVAEADRFSFARYNRALKTMCFNSFSVS